MEQRQTLEVAPDLPTQIEQWKMAQQVVRDWAAYEKTLRERIVTGLADASKEEGTETVTAPTGDKLKIVKKQYYKLANKNNELDAMLEAHKDVIPDDLAALLIKWEPDLNVKNFKALAPEVQALFNDVLTVTPGMPSIELVPTRGVQ